jgi:hypothetical protein
MKPDRRKRPREARHCRHLLESVAENPARPRIPKPRAEQREKQKASGDPSEE